MTNTLRDKYEENIKNNVHFPALNAIDFGYVVPVYCNHLVTLRDVEVVLQTLFKKGYEISTPPVAVPDEKGAQKIAQWVIDNRYPKSENDGISDFEMFNELVKALSSTQPTKEGSDAVSFLDWYMSSNYYAQNAPGKPSSFINPIEHKSYTTAELYSIFKQQTPGEKK